MLTFLISLSNIATSINWTRTSLYYIANQAISTNMYVTMSTQQKMTHQLYTMISFVYHQLYIDEATTVTNMLWPYHNSSLTYSPSPSATSTPPTTSPAHSHSQIYYAAVYPPLSSPIYPSPALTILSQTTSTISPPTQNI